MRPNTFQELIGQNRAKTQISIAIRAAQERGAVLDHTLLTGPKGTGKTTIAKLTASAFGRQCIETTGQVLSSASELTAILCGLRAGDFLFIDEIHRLPGLCQDALLKAMEDGEASVTVGKGQDVRILPIKLQPFTLLAATTRHSLLAGPLQDRFTNKVQLEFYSIDELAKIIERVEPSLEISLDPEARTLLASLSRSTPRTAIQLLRQLRDYVQLAKVDTADSGIVQQAMQVLDIGPLGLTGNEVKILEALVWHFKGEPAGIEVLSAMLDQEQDTVKEYENYLLRLGMIDRTPKGRVAKAAAYEYLGAQKGLKVA